MIESKTGAIGRLFWMIVPYLLLLLVHIVYGLNRDTPFVVADEFGYLGNARYLAGVSHYPDLTVARFYHFGYSLFILPAFWLFSNTESTYRGIMIINAILISSLYFAIYYILRSLFRYEQKITSIIAFITCLYTAFQVQSSIAWAENAIIPLYGFLVCSFGALLFRRSFTTAALFGFLAGFEFTVNPRGLTLMAMCGFALVVLGLTKKLPREKVLFGIAIMIAVYFVTNVVNRQLQPVGLNAGRYFHGLFSASGLKNYALLLGGQILYLIQATYGLVIVGFVYIASLIRKTQTRDFADRERANQKMILIFVFFTSIGLVLLMNIPMAYGIWRKTAGHIPIRADHLMYGRYAEPVLSLYLAFALIALRYDFFQDSRKRYRIMLATVFLTAALALLVQFGQGYGMLSTRRIAMVNLAGIYPLASELGRMDVGVISLTSIFLFLVLVELYKRKFLWGSILVVVLFCSASFYDLHFYIKQRQEQMKARNVLPRSIRELGGIQDIAYDFSFFAVEQYLVYQYLLPEVKFYRFSSKENELPGSKVVISSMRWINAKKLRAKLITCETKNDNSCLWLIPERRLRMLQ